MNHDNVNLFNLSNYCHGRINLYESMKKVMDLYRSPSLKARAWAPFLLYCVYLNLIYLLYKILLHNQLRGKGVRN